MSRRRTTVTLVAASVLLTVAALTACSGPTPPAPTTAPTHASAPASAAPGPTTPAPSPTWPPQVALPTPPPEMARDDETGAIAAADFFLFDLYPYVEFTQDTSRWAAMSHPDCVFCKSVLETVASERAAGTVTAVASMHKYAVSVREVNPAMFAVTYDVDTGPDQRYTLSGDSLGSTSKVRGTVIVIVVHQSGTWITRGVDLKKRT